MAKYSYVPVERRQARRALLREANNILSADRRSRRRATTTPLYGCAGGCASRRVGKPTPVQSVPSMPRRWTLSDLPLLRRRGLIP